MACPLTSVRQTALMLTAYLYVLLQYCITLSHPINVLSACYVSSTSIGSFKAMDVHDATEVQL